MKKVTCLMPTYGRFSIVCRSVSFFLAQTYENKELLIYNQSPVAIQDPQLPGVKVVNVTREFPGGLGEIYTEAFKFCDGDLINMWDDDNGQFPWFLEETIANKQKRGAKTESSWCWMNSALQLAQNLIEPSVVMDREVIEQYGFTRGMSFVHTKWFYGLYHAGELQLIGPEVTPGLVYVWGEQGSGCWHISCTNDEKQGFEGFRKNSKDFGDGVLRPYDIQAWYRKVAVNHPELLKRLA